MSPTALAKKRIVPQADLRCSDEMKHQLQMALSKRHHPDGKIPDLNIVTFDSDLEKAVPEVAISWSKSTCC